MEIASTKRVDDGVRIRSRQTQRIDWKEILEHILRMRRQQLEKLRYDLEEELARDSPAGRPLSQVIHKSGFRKTRILKIV